MSEEKKLKWLELTAVMLAAVFVWTPLFIASRPVIAGRGQAQSAYEYQQQEQPAFFVLWGPDILGVLTLAVLVFQARIFDRQATLANRQRKLMRGQMKAAITAAKASQTSADAALYAELPLFTIANQRVAVATGSALDGGHEIEIRNEGRTPARITSDFLHVFATQSLIDYSFPMAQKEELDNEFFLPNGGTYKLSRKQRIDRITWQTLMAAEAVAWIYGYINYTDFTERRRRFAFCFVGVPSRPTMYDTMSPDRLTWIRHGGGKYNYHRSLAENE